MTEYLSLADYLLIAEAILDVPAEVLALSTNLNMRPATRAPSICWKGQGSWCRPTRARGASSDRADDAPTLERVDDGRR